MLVAKLGGMAFAFIGLDGGMGRCPATRARELVELVSFVTVASDAPSTGDAGDEPG